MALSTATIAFDLSDALGTDFSGKAHDRSFVRVSTNIPGDTVVDTVGNKIRIGGGSVRPANDGTGSVTVWVPGTGSNPSTWQTYVTVHYVDAGTSASRIRTFGPFTVTTNADLADLIAEQEIPPTYLSSVTTALDAKVTAAAGSATAAAGSATAAAASAATAVSVSGISTPDGVVAALVPLGGATTAALSNSFGVLTINNTTTAAQITAWLAQPYDGWKRLVGSAVVSDTIVIPSDTSLDATGATLTMAFGTNKRLIENAACTPQRVISGSSVCVANDKTVQVPGAGFTSADIGRVLAVAFTNESVRGVDAYGTITAINSSTSVEIDTAPLYSQVGGVTRIYDRDRNIHIRGGYFDRAHNQGTGTNYVTLNFYRVDGISLNDMMIVGAIDPGRGYAAQLGDCTNIDVDYRVDSSADGIHLTGPIKDGRIRVVGHCLDDIIGITTTNYGPYNDLHGDIEGLDLWAEGEVPNGIRHILLATSTAGGLPGATQYPDGHSIRRVHVHKVRDTSPGKTSRGVVTWVQGNDSGSRIEDLIIENADCPVTLLHNAHGKVTLNNTIGLVTLAAMSLSDYGNTAAVIEDLTINGLTGDISTNDGRLFIHKLTVRGGTLPYLSLRSNEARWVLLDRVTFLNRILDVGNGCDVGVLTLANCIGTTNYASGIGVIAESSTVVEFNVTDCALAATATTNGALVQVISGSSLEIQRVARSTITRMGDVLDNRGTTQTALSLTDATLVSCERIAEGTGGAVVKYANLTFGGAGATEPFYASGAMVISGSGFTSTVAPAVVVASGSARVIDPAFRTNIAPLAKNIGDTAYNTNAGLSCGVGPVVCNGSNWKNLYSGATY